MVDEDDIQEHMAYLRRAERFTFWYGWICGAAFTSGFLLVVRLLLGRL